MRRKSSSGGREEHLGHAENVERRRDLRRRVMIPAFLDDASESNAVIVDISRSGFAVMNIPQLELGVTRLRLRFTLPETDELVRATGEVRWRDGTGRCGVSLVAIDCKPGDWHGWLDTVKAPARIVGERPNDGHASETDHPTPSKLSYRSLRLLGVGILVIAALAGVVVRGRPMLSAFLSAQRSPASRVAAQNLPSGTPKDNQEGATPQITIVEGPPALAKPVLSDQEPAKIKRGRLVHRIDPVFPEAALDSGIVGDVRAVLTITEKGSVEQVDIVQGDDRLANEVVTTLGHWRYLPFTLDGRAVSVKLPITVSFVLRQRGRSSLSDPRR